MHLRHATRIALVGLAALSAPMLTHAGENTAVDSCLKTFLSSDFAKDRKVTVREINDSTVRPLAFYASSPGVELVARGRESGKEIARVVCHVDSSGAIVSVDAQPASAVAAH